MENKIDQFFKDKVEGHSSPPSEDAWARLEARLSKKNNAGGWRIAAAILIAGALVSTVIWSRFGADKNQPDSVSKILPKEKEANKIPAVKNSPKEKTAVLAPETSATTVAPRRAARQGVHHQPVAATTPLSMDMTGPMTSSSEPKLEKNKFEDKVTSEATQPSATASTARKSIKLEFTLEDFAPGQTVATTSEAKTTGLKKVWELAREVKNGEGPVHEIKNELFALNFKKK